jgi:uncharacterized protein YifE (UPF0438 family)
LFYGIIYYLYVIKGIKQFLNKTNNIKQNTMRTLLINKKAFIDWYFDQDVKETFFDDQQILKNLEQNGVFTITLNELLQNVGYMPKEIATEGQDLVLDEEGEEIDKFAYDKVAFTNSLKITLEKEVLFLVGEVKTRYNILVNDRCVDICYDEAIALESYEKTKANYSAPTKQTIKEEFV